MLIYEITSDDGQGLARYASRKRRDAAALIFERMVFDAVSALGLRDRQAGHDAMEKAKGAYLPVATSRVIKVGPYTLTFTVERMKD